MSSAEIIRLPVRPRPRVVAGSTDGAVPASGTRGGNSPSARALGVLANPKTPGGLTVLDRLLADGTLDAHQHAAALAYAVLRRRHDRAKTGGRGLAPELWAIVKRDHARLLRAAGAERFVLDRLCLDDDAPLSSEVERVRAALERVAKLLSRS